MFKQIKKLFIALVLVFALFLVACEECPECKECPTCPTCEEFNPEVECPENGYITKEECPAPEECPEFNAGVECPENGYIKPEECPECEGYTAPTEVVFYSDDIVVGKDVKFEVEITPADAYQGLVWSTSNPEIATVDEEGNITGVRPGMVTITAKSALNAEVMYEEELEVIEKGLLDFEIAEREKNAIVAALSAGYVSGNFDLPTTWNQNATVTYMDPNGNEIETFVMPDLGDATSQNYAISGNVTYGDAVAEFNVTLKLVKAAEGKNDYEKVDFAVEVAQAFLYDYINGAKVTESVYLPASVYGIALGWSTNKAYVLDNTGALTRPNNDQTVTYTITPKCGAASRSTTIAVVAAGYSADEKIEYLKKDGALKDIVNGKFAATIALPEKDDKFGIHLTYVSSNEDVITSEGKVNDSLIENTKVTFTVTAVYNDLNAADTAFVEVFQFEVTALASNNSTQMLAGFATTHEQFAHIAYGKGTEQTYVITPEEGANLKAQGFTFKGDENFKVNEDGSVELVTQYFRYHEAKLTVTHTTSEEEKASYVWVINVGIGAENDIVYLGGRSQSNQASKNPNERGDMLQGFSKWDKYVGIVSSNSERTTQQYWSEFSGYTYYVDVPTGKKVTKFTKDMEGNVTVVAYEEDDYTRHQFFLMEFATIHITGKTAVYEANKDKVLGYVPRTTVKYIRSTYGGNFGSFFVNDLDQAFDLPVSALSMGGTFADGEAMKTYTKSSISKAVEAKKAAVELKDDYGSNLTVKRDNTWAFDGYRPAVVIAPVVSQLLEEGQTDVKYKFTFGVEDVEKNPNNNGTVYVQYGIKSTLSKVWDTPFLPLAPYGMAMSWRSQTLYSLSNIGGYALAGADKSLPVYVSRYFRHAENEEISDYFIAQVKNELEKYTEVTYDKVKASDVKYEDLGTTNLKALDALYTEYNTLYASWQNKTDVKAAKAALDAMKAAAASELAKQAAYAELTQKSFDDVKVALDALKAKTDKEVKETINGADFQAKLAAAKRNYAAFTTGQKRFYDGGYAAGAAGLSFTAQKTAGILEAIELELQIIALNKAVSTSNAANVKAAADALAKLAEKELYTGVKANTLITTASVAKLDALKVAKALVEVKIETLKINEAYNAYTALDADKKAIVEESFKNVVFGDLKGIDAYKAAKLDQVAKNAAAAFKANEEKTLVLAKEIKDMINSLPSVAEFKKGEYTADQVKVMKQVVIADGKNASKIDQLVALYVTLGIIATTPTDADGKINALVNGRKVLGDNPATTDVVETDYPVLDTKIGNFNGEGEKALLEKAFSLPGAYDEAEANKVIETVELLPGAKLLSLENEAQVKAARTAYDALTAAQKEIANKYTSANYIKGKLEAAEEAILNLKKQQRTLPVEVAISAIGAVASLTLEGKAKVAEARRLYNALSADDKGSILPASLALLESAEDKIEALELEQILESETYKAAVKAFADNTEIANVVNKDTKAGADALVAAYEAMNAAEKAYFAKTDAAAQLLYEQLVSALEVYNLYA